MDFVRSHLEKMQLWPVEHFFHHKRVPVILTVLWFLARLPTIQVTLFLNRPIRSDLYLKMTLISNTQQMFFFFIYRVTSPLKHSLQLWTRPPHNITWQISGSSPNTPFGSRLSIIMEKEPFLKRLFVWLYLISQLTLHKMSVWRLRLQPRLLSDGSLHLKNLKMESLLDTKSDGGRKAKAKVKW